MFSIKSTVSVDHRVMEVGGPWEPTLSAAVSAYVDVLVCKGFGASLVIFPVVQEEAPKWSTDRLYRRRGYKIVETLQLDLVERLTKAGLSVST